MATVPNDLPPLTNEEKAVMHDLMQSPNPYKCRNCDGPAVSGDGLCLGCKPLGAEGNPLAQQVGGDHYRKLAIQPAKFIHVNGIGHLAGDAIAYLCRYPHKNGVEDLKKARHTIDILIALEEEAANAKEPA